MSNVTRRVHTHAHVNQLPINGQIAAALTTNTVFQIPYAFTRNRENAMNL